MVCGVKLSTKHDIDKLFRELSLILTAETILHRSIQDETGHCIHLPNVYFLCNCRHNITSIFCNVQGWNVSRTNHLGTCGVLTHRNEEMDIVRQNKKWKKSMHIIAVRTHKSWKNFDTYVTHIYLLQLWFQEY